MAIYDEKTPGVLSTGNHNNFSVINKVGTQDNIIFKTSYVVASDLIIKGKITALFDLVVLGNIDADNIDVKGRLFCTGDCEVKDSVVIQDKLIVGRLKANRVEASDQIIAREIDVNVIKVDGDIIVSQTLATTDCVDCAQNILCGDTAFGTGKIIANSLITVEELDLDGGSESVVIPKRMSSDDGEGKKKDRYKSWISKNDYHSYILKLDSDGSGLPMSTLTRWLNALRKAETIFSQGKVNCFDVGVLLTLTEIANCPCFQGWSQVYEWWVKLLDFFTQVVEGLKEKIEKKLSKRDFTLGKCVIHKDYGRGKITEVKNESGSTITVIFDDGQKKSFIMDLALKFFTVEEEKKYYEEELVDRLFVKPTGYIELIEYVAILERYGKVFVPKLNDKVKDLLYSKIGIKPKFISDRIKENGWE